MGRSWGPICILFVVPARAVAPLLVALALFNRRQGSPNYQKNSRIFCPWGTAPAAARYLHRVLCIIEAAGAVPHDGQLFYGHHRLSMEPPSAVQKLFLKPACYTGLIPGAIYPYL